MLQNPSACLPDQHFLSLNTRRVEHEQSGKRVHHGWTCSSSYRVIRTEIGVLTRREQLQATEAWRSILQALQLSADQRRQMLELRRRFLRRYGAILQARQRIASQLQVPKRLSANALTILSSLGADCLSFLSI